MPLTATQLNDLPHTLAAICEKLRAADPDIVAIVQFGSSVYAPDLACDVDLLVITQRRKDPSVYWDATMDAPCWVDVIPVETSRGKMTPHLALGVRTVSRLLWGDREAVERMVTEVAVPTFDEAREVLTVGEGMMQMAAAETRQTAREAYRRNAFNTLFDAARLAAMCFLDTEESRWGELRRQLPAPFAERFRAIIDELHVAIWYHRDLPLVDVEEEYQAWRERVEQFINDLEKAASGA
ncbi:MAG: hypothetical protein NZT92_05550 [Abditibacteriales bacterium]|nr:hypothetical protein [Abditibacteriales bacterium]